jgi:hypothetical protein
MRDFKDLLTFGARRIKARMGGRLGAKPAPGKPQGKPPNVEEHNGGIPPRLLERNPPTFFLLGRAKSGTSWLMRTLNAHPEVLCRGEGRFFGREYLRESPENARGIKIQPTSLYGAIADSERLRQWVERSVWSRDEDPERHLANLTSLATSYFLNERLAKSGKRMVGDKTPFTGAEVVAEIKEMRPDAKLIHIIRDGRDVTVSSIHHVWNHAFQEGGIHELTPDEFEKREAYRADPQGFLESGQSIFAGKQLHSTAKNWAEMVGRAMQDGPELFGENYVEVRYEDLLENPEGEMQHVLRFLGADPNLYVVRRCLEVSSFERRTKGRERGQEDSTAFLRKGIAGDWKNVFTEEDKEVFKEAAGEMLVKLGYEKDDRW